MSIADDQLARTKAARRSKRKGATGENEVRDLARAHGFLECRRNFGSGASGGGDLTGIPGVHIEVKRVERLDLPKAWRQACAAAASTETCVVAHRKSGGRWLATLELDELLTLLRLREV